MKILIRLVEPEDHAFVYATYLRNGWFDKNNKTTLKRSTWSAMQHKRLEKILDEDNVWIACLSEDKDTILGYAFMDETSPYCYIKLAFRGEGFNLKDKLLKELSK